MNLKIASIEACLKTQNRQKRATRSVAWYLLLRSLTRRRKTLFLSYLFFNAFSLIAIHSLNSLLLSTIIELMKEYKQQIENENLLSVP